MINKTGLMFSLLLLVLLSVGGHPQFVGGGGFSANAVLWFYGTGVTAQFTGEMTLSGTVVLNGESVPFNAKGGLHGDAEGDSSTMVGTGWGIFTASGRSSTGEEFKLFGGLTADTSDIAFSGEAAGGGSAPFFVVVVIAGERFAAVGTASATASGGFVTPDDPYTMELAGTGSLGFRSASLVPLGDRSIEASDLPWDLSGWPADLKSELLSLLGVVDIDRTGCDSTIDTPGEWDDQGI